jgi:hypothetical protein
MRDTGVPGHVLIADRMETVELASLARPNVFFFQPVMNRGSCAVLLEYQTQIAVEKDALHIVFDMMDEYTIQKIVLMNPDPESVEYAVAHFDPDQIVAGGYCLRDCGEYWKTLTGNAAYWK